MRVATCQAPAQVPGTSEAIISPPNNLPAPLNPLIGRDHELETVSGSAASSGCAPGDPDGTGRCRQDAAEPADRRRSAGRFSRWRLSSSPWRPSVKPELVPSAIAEALGVRDAPHQPLVQTLMLALRAKALLLVLDNFEHVASAAPLVTELLRAGPHLKVLATSREALHLNGEHEFVVPPLPCPRSGDDHRPPRLWRTSRPSSSSGNAPRLHDMILWWTMPPARRLPKSA